MLTDDLRHHHRDKKMPLRAKVAAPGVYRLMHLRSIALLCLAPFLAGAQTLSPTAYVVQNGEAGPGGLLYRDDSYSGAGDAKQDRSALSGGLGQLTDGAVGCSDDPTTDCGGGAGYEFVGWRSSDPTITFQFGQRSDFRTIRVHTANWPDAAVRLWKTATVSFSDDGFTFRNYTVRTTTPEEQQDRHARYLSIPVNASAYFVRVRLIRSDPRSWILVSDVRFEGRISRDQNADIKPK